MTQLSSWPAPPREPGPWGGGPPVAPPGNTALPPLPGPGGVSRTSAGATNPWTNAEAVPGPTRQGFPGLGAAGVPRIDRAPRAIIVLSAIVVLALVAGGAFVVLRGGRHYPSSWDPRVDPIAQWVAKDRKLAYEHPVEVEFLTPAEYKAASTGDGDGTANAQALDDALAEFRALGLVSGKVDLGKAIDTLSDSGTLAYYDQAKKKIFVRGTTITPSLRVTLAHELTHVLQDQHFDLQRLDKLPDNTAPVLRALAEGDATRIEDHYIAKVLTPAERKVHETGTSADAAAAKAVDDKVPPAMSAFFSSPYIFGPELISYLEAKGGDDAIDAALKDPPTEAVLFDPTIHGTPAAKDTKVEVPTPSGAKAIESGEFGRTAWYLLLASRLDPRQALVAADGLSGDGYVVFRKNDKVCVQARATGDTPGDVDQMVAALKAWSAKSPPGIASASAKDGVLTFQSCDPGEAAKAVGKVSTELLQLPATRTEIYNGVVKQGADPDKAACYANGVVRTFTLRQLHDEAYVGSPAGQQALMNARKACA